MSLPAGKNAQFGADAPLGRPGQPGELAPLYVLLASDDSRYVSGEVIGATGGRPLHWGSRLPGAPTGVTGCRGA